jgi:hypothetical protein
MRMIDRKRTLFNQIVLLRRAERSNPLDRDIAAVRAALEGELGPTMSRNLAASLLGVSHTALARWARAGDLPTVPRPDGREELPVTSVLELYEELERASNRGQRGHVLEPAMIRGRVLADRLDPDALVGDVPSGSDGHDRAARRSLAYHRAVARRLRRAMADEALRRVWRWRDQGRIDAIYADRWEQLLSQPVPMIRAAISEDSADARDLRQNSPFAGMLSEPERRKILETIR